MANAIKKTSDFISSDFTPIRRWFSGKSLTTIDTLVLPVLAEAELQGYWPAGASRKVHAAITKANVAAKMGKALDKRYQAASYEHDNKERSIKNAWFKLLCSCRYGSNIDAAQNAIDLLRERQDELSGDHDLALLNIAAKFVADMLPVEQLVKRLDATRPKPVFTSLGLSPTVTATLTEQLKLNVATIRFPEMKEEWVERMNDKGAVVRVPVIKILWPAGTIHNASKHAFSNTNNDKCHACGHAIRNAFNWVPFLMDDAAGVPHSMWVGRDCARSIFNVDMKGEAEYANRTEVK